MDIGYKIAIIFGLFGLAMTGLACEKELKEHPMPVSLKRKMEMQNDPEVMAKKVSGTITIADSAKGKRSLAGMLFIFARSEGQEDGPPLAVKRVRNATFPLEYNIGQIDTMLPGANFSGEVQITARLDGDGIAGAGPGDFEGKVVAQVGSENIDIVIGHSASSKSKTPINSSAISGTLKIDDAVKDKIPNKAYLFIYARSADKGPGTPPLAVKRLQGVTFPYKFSISEADSMIPGSKIKGNVLITARLDADGDAKPSPGDVEGITRVLAGQNGVSITLGKIVGPKSNSPKETSKTIKGIVSVSSDIEKDLTEGIERLFIILRQKGISGAPPMAVQLHRDVKFPFSYEIGQKDAMMTGTIIEGDVEVIVRVDRDGNAKASPGDFEGEGFATVGDEDVNITLNKRV